MAERSIVWDAFVLSPTIANVNTKAHVLVWEGFTCQSCGVPLFLAQAIKVLDWHAPDLELWDLHGKKEPLRSRWATVDHALSEAEGGFDTLDNLFAYCVTCNSRKGRLSASPARNRVPIHNWKGLSQLFLAMAPDYTTRLSTEDKRWLVALSREGVRPDLSDLDRALWWLRRAKVEGVESLNNLPE